MWQEKLSLDQKMQVQVLALPDAGLPSSLWALAPQLQN